MRAHSLRRRGVLRNNGGVLPRRNSQARILSRTPSGDSSRSRPLPLPKPQGIAAPAIGSHEPAPLAASAAQSPPSSAVEAPAPERRRSPGPHGSVHAFGRAAKPGKSARRATWRSNYARESPTRFRDEPTLFCLLLSGSPPVEPLAEIEVRRAGAHEGAQTRSTGNDARRDAGNRSRRRRGGRARSAPRRPKPQPTWNPRHSAKCYPCPGLTLTAAPPPPPPPITATATDNQSRSGNAATSPDRPAGANARRDESRLPRTNRSRTPLGERAINHGSQSG